MPYRADIDGLRAVAILLVVGFHVGLPGFDGGFVGVDVFFVLSGFLITSLLWRELEADGAISWRDFYARRARRLLPALILVVGATLVVSAFVLIPDPDFRWLGQSAIATATFLSNVFFQLKTSDYFGGRAEEMPLLNTWSLAVEEQFYLVWPVVIWLAWHVARRRRRPLIGALVVLAIVVLASFAFALIAVSRDRSLAFYSMPSRLWELALGGVLAVLQLHRRLVRERLVEAVAVVGWLLVVASAVLLSSGAPFPGALALPVVAGTAALVAAGGAGRSRTLALLASPALVRLGKWSYSWYLVHWPALTLVRRVTLEHDVMRDSLVAAAALIVAALLYRFVEQPARQQQWGITRGSRRPLLVGTLAIALTAVAGVAVHRDSYALSQLSLTDSEASALRENRTARDACPNLPTGGGDVVDCVFSPERHTVLVLVGDSHALALLPAAHELADQLGWSLEVLWDTACPFIVGYEPPPGARRLGSDCERENRNNAAYLLAASDRIGGVMVTSRSTSWVVHDTDAATAEAADRWRLALGSTLSNLKSVGLQVAVMHDVPRFDLDVPHCLIRRDECNQDREAAASFRAPVAEAEAAAALEAGAAAWDPFDALCDERTCWAEIDDVVLYRDRDHLSWAGASFLAPEFVEAMSAALGDGG